jgi:homoserine kinase type II
MGIHEATELFRQSRGAAMGVRELQGPLEWDFLTTQIADLLGGRYDVGEPCGVEQIMGGYENLSFAVYVRGDEGAREYFLRKYRCGTVADEIGFEHAFLSHLGRSRFGLSPRPIAARDGGTCAAVEELHDGEPVTRFFALFSFLEGEDRYAWFENPRRDIELVSSARVLARLHEASSDFEPGGSRRLQEPVLEFIPGLVPVFEECARRAGDTGFDREFLAHVERIDQVITLSRFDSGDLTRMPCFALHADYHAGNLKYAGDAVVGVFDFDDSKLDYRVFEIALAVANMCTSWDPADDGALRFDKLALFVSAYQEEASHRSAPGPMNDTELAALWRMIANANLNLLSWEVVFFYSDREADVSEYLRWLRHHLRAMEFIEGHEGEIAAAVGAVR